MKGNNRLAELIPAHVRSIQPYVPGKPISEVEREYGLSGTIKLASNENPLGPGPCAREAMHGALRDIGLYPDGAGFELKGALARQHRVPTTSITLGNGSNDLLVLLAETFLTPETEAVYSQYGFAIYALAIQATGAQARVAPAHAEDAPMPLGHDLTTMLRLVTPKTRVVFVANPNNPTGTWLGADALRAFLRSLPSSTITVIDEAYYEYSRQVDCPDASEWLSEFPNLVVLRTFSKAYGLAGLRVGYALSHPDIADALNRIRQPFNVNSVALAAATAALQDADHLARTVALNQRGLEQLHRGLGALGLKTLPSAGNFVLVHLSRRAAPTSEALLTKGIVVRPVGGYGLPEHLRVSTGTAAQNDRFLQALEDVLGETAKAR